MFSTPLLLREDLMAAPKPAVVTLNEMKMDPAEEEY